MNVDYEVRNKVMNTLIECRKEKGISQKELAQVVDLKETTVEYWEQGNKTMNYMYGEQEGEQP